MLPSEAQTAEAVIRAARECVGTPFQHQGRLPEHGLDCVGLLIHAFGAAGLEGIDGQVPYRRPPPSDLLERELARYLTPVDHRRDPEPGDVVVIEIANRRCHAGLVTESATVIHADARGTVETRLDRAWVTHRRSTWRWQQQH